MPERSTRPLATQLRATPPARQRLRTPKLLTTSSTSCVTTSSVMSWIDAAISISRCVSSFSGDLGGRAEQLVELGVRHAQAGAVLEVREIEMEGAVRLDLDQVVADQLGVFRLAVGREPHHLVLAGIDLEPEIVGERRVEQAERMREMDLAVDLDRVVLAQPRRGRRPFADAIHRQDRRCLEGRWIEGARRMRLMMLGEHQLLVDVDLGHVPRQLVRQHLALEQLLARPHRKRGRKGAKAARRQGQVGLEQALELQERLVVEDDVVDVLERHPAGLEAVFDGLSGKGRVVAHAREALLLRRRNDVALLHQRCRAVMVEGGDPEDVHP